MLLSGDLRSLAEILLSKLRNSGFSHDEIVQICKVKNNFDLQDDLLHKLENAALDSDEIEALSEIRSLDNPSQDYKLRAYGYDPDVYFTPLQLKQKLLSKLKKSWFYQDEITQIFKAKADSDLPDELRQKLAKLAMSDEERAGLQKIRSLAPLQIEIFIREFAVRPASDQALLAESSPPEQNRLMNGVFNRDHLIPPVPELIFYTPSDQRPSRSSIFDPMKDLLNSPNRFNPKKNDNRSGRKKK